MTALDASAILEATIAYVNEAVSAAEPVQAADQEYLTAYKRVSEALTHAARADLALGIDSAANACVAEAIRAAFLMGLTFNLNALVVEAATGFDAQRRPY